MDTITEPITLTFPQWLDAEYGRGSRLARHLHVTRGAVERWRRDGVARRQILAVWEYSGRAISLESLIAGPSQEAACTATNE